MKKILCFLLIACLSLGIIGVASVSAADNEVLMGTPIVDGQLDDMYKESLTIVLSGEPEDNAFGSPNAEGFVASATVYALYDSDFVYLCAVVTDDDVVQPDDSYYDTFNANGFDGIEFRLNFADCTDSSKQFKVTADAHTQVRHTYGEDARGCFTIQPAICDITRVVAESTLTDDGYIIEVAVGHSYNDNNKLLEAGELGLNMWLLDLQEFAEGSLSPIGGSEYFMYGEDFGSGNGAAFAFPLSNDVVTGGLVNDAPDTTPETEPETEAPETDPVTEAPETDPVTEEPETDPVTEEPETDPVTEAPETDPVTDPVTDAPAVSTDPVDTPDDAEGGNNTGLIIGIVAAVVVVVAIIAIVLGKKKKA